MIHTYRRRFSCLQFTSFSWCITCRLSLRSKIWSWLSVFYSIKFQSLECVLHVTAIEFCSETSGGSKFQLLAHISYIFRKATFFKKSCTQAPFRVLVLVLLFKALNEPGPEYLKTTFSHINTTTNSGHLSRACSMFPSFKVGWVLFQ